MTTVALDPQMTRKKERPFTVLVVEDNPSDTELLLHTLEQADLKVFEGELDLVVRSTAEGALQLLKDRVVDLVLTDMVLPGMSGLDLVSHIRNLDPNLPTFIITWVDKVPMAVDAMRRGAFDYLIKPVNVQDLGVRLHRAVRISEILRRNAVLEHLIKQELSEPSFVGATETYRDIVRRAYEAAQGRHPVLITGETGTGKGLLARMIHEECAEREKSFQVIDCTTLPEGTAESELFGHVRGAFTGAIADKPGLIELANGGTAFLDEIGDLPLPLQAKLLRVLEDYEVRPVGGTRMRRLDMRFIAATNQNLQEKVRTGAFRKDLYYRLAATVIHIPPLRERLEDIPIIARHFTAQFAKDLRKPGCYLDASAVAALMAYPWPGNVRELKNVIERAVTLASGDSIADAQIKPLLQGQPETRSEMEVASYLGDPYLEARKRVLALFSRAYLKAKLAMAGGNIGKAAEDSGMTRQHFGFLMKRYLKE